VDRVLGNKNVASGVEAKLIWQMVTNLKRIKGELEKSQGQLQAIIHHAMDGIITINNKGEILGFNPAAENMFGYTQQEILGRTVELLMAVPVQGDPDSGNWFALSGQGQVAEVRRREVTAVCKGGAQLPMELSASEMVLSGQRYFIGIVRDITERKLAESKIAHLAHYDYLTNLPNRALFLDRLAQAVALAGRGGYKVAVMFLDLDRFKQVNDTLGHECGDLLLQAVAGRLKEIVRVSDTIARMWGDELTFALNNIGTTKNAALVANKMIVALGEKFDLNGQCCYVGGSIGVSIFPDDSRDPEQLIRQADEAMYLAKQSGKNTCKHYREITGKPLT
jgi:diguanylate cyclase (GGDEF)-like protein/PAS domain S-box-containing protein